MHLFKFDINFIKIHVYILGKILMDCKEKLNKHKKHILM